MDLNRAQIIGNITQDLELRQTPNGQNVISFSIATNRSWTDSSGSKQEQVEFHNIVLWGRTAEVANQYLRKGSKIFVEGRLQTRSWEAQDGTKRYKTEIVGDNMIMLDRKQDQNNENRATSSHSPTNETPAINKKEPKKEEEISIDDIPF